MRVLLSSVTAPDERIDVPKRYACNYESLVMLAYAELGKEGEEKAYDVHFHRAHDQGCDGRLGAWLYNNGEYFSDDHVHDNKFIVYAHFVLKAGEEGTAEHPIDISSDNVQRSYRRIVQRQSEATSSKAYDNTDTSEDELNPFPPVRLTRTATRKHSRDDASDNITVRHRQLRAHRARPQRRVHSETSDVMDTAKENDRDELAFVTQYLEDLHSMTDNGPEESSKLYRPNFRDLQKPTRTYLAHCELIEGNLYGVEAKKSCEACKERSETCRVYHKDIQQDVQRVRAARAVGGKCSVCRRLHLFCDAE